MTIDWSKPLEHVDGTPLRLAEVGEYQAPYNPDLSGDYYLVREDGLDFTDDQIRGAVKSLLICGPHGVEWGHYAGSGVVVRNRAEDPEPAIRFPDGPGSYWLVRETSVAEERPHMRYVARHEGEPSPVLPHVKAFFAESLDEVRRKLRPKPPTWQELADLLERIEGSGPTLGSFDWGEVRDTCRRIRAAKF